MFAFKLKCRLFAIYICDFPDGDSADDLPGGFGAQFSWDSSPWKNDPYYTHVRNKRWIWVAAEKYRWVRPSAKGHEV